MKDWTGNKNSLFKTLGASNHTDKEREANDYYATDPIAIDKLVAAYPLTFSLNALVRKHTPTLCEVRDMRLRVWA